MQGLIACHLQGQARRFIYKYSMHELSRGRERGERRRRRWLCGDDDKGMYEKGLIDSMYSESPCQQRHGPDLQGAKNGACYMESIGFSRRCVLVALANKVWVIHMSSSIWIGARREGELGCKEKRFDRKAARAAEDGLEARRAG